MVGGDLRPLGVFNVPFSITPQIFTTQPTAREASYPLVDAPLLSGLFEGTLPPQALPFLDPRMSSVGATV
eukprot:scaffold125857_cov35-Tisochrysis_lutea.AAC.8